MKEQHLEILSDGLKLQAVLQTPNTNSWPIVVLCHGLLSHKDSSKYRKIAQEFALESLATVRFDFRGCGESEGLLSESSVSSRWRDLQRVIDRVLALDGYDGRLGLLGSSLGGYLALLEASRNPRVRCGAVWSTPSHLHDLAKRFWEITEVQMSEECYEDLSRVKLLPRLKKVRRILIVHGQEDHEVPPKHASSLLAALEQPKALHLLKDGDHRFTQPEVRQEAIRLSMDWFQRFL